MKFTLSQRHNVSLSPSHFLSVSLRLCSFILLSLILTACTKAPPHPELVSLIMAEYKSHPTMELQDVYKLLYQAEFGVAHFLKTPEAAKEYLFLEAKSLQPKNIDEALVTPCSPDGKILHVNLRPFVKKNLSLDTLFICMMETASNMRGSDKRLREMWKHVGEIIDEKAIPFSKDAYREFTEEIEKKNFIAVNHSRIYTTEYKPAYRVVSKLLFENYFRPQQ